MKATALALIAPNCREENPFVPVPRLRETQKIGRTAGHER